MLIQACQCTKRNIISHRCAHVSSHPGDLLVNRDPVTVPPDDRLVAALESPVPPDAAPVPRRLHPSEEGFSPAAFDDDYFTPDQAAPPGACARTPIT